MQADVNINVTANTADAEQKLRKVGDQLKGAAQGGSGTAAANPAAGGASGQAVANANLMFGLPEETGLTLVPLFP